MLWLLTGLTSLATAAPTLDWTVTYSRTTRGSGWYRASHTDTSGNTYVIFEDSNFGTRLLKYDPAGSVVGNVTLDVLGAWIKTMTVDSFGNIIAGGELFDTAAGYNNLFIARYDATTGNPVWSVTYDSGYDDTAYAVTTDSKGNVFISGSFFNPVGNDDALVVKYDSTGTWKWAQTVIMGSTSDEYGYAVATDGTGNVYVVGTYDAYPFLVKFDVVGTEVFRRQYTTKIGFNARAVTYVASSDSLYLALDNLNVVTVLQVNAAIDGSIAASGTYNPPALPSVMNIVSGIAVDSLGSVFVAGITIDFSAVPENYDLLLVKFDPSLTFVWKDTYDRGGWDGLGFPIPQVRVGVGSGLGSDVYLSGSVSPFSCYGEQNPFVRRYNGAGTAQWTRLFTQPVLGEVIGAATDLSGNIYVGVAREADPVLLKYDSNGVFQWVQRLSSGGVCAFDAAGLVHQGGLTYLSMSEYSSASFLSQAKVVKYDDTGTQVGSLSFGKILNSSSYGGPITLDGSGNVYLAGSFWSSTTFESELFVVKFDSTGALQWARTLNFALYDDPTGIALDGVGGLYVLESTPNDGMSNNEFGLIKLDSTSGNVLWTKAYTPDPMLDCLATGLKATASQVFLVGMDLGVLDAWGRLYRLDISGNVVWTQAYDGGQDAAFASLAIDPFGTLVVTGAIGSYLLDTSDVLTLAYDPGGAVLWSVSFDSGSPEDWGSAVAIGSVYVAAETGVNARLLKYTETPASIDASLALDPPGTVSLGRTVTATLTMTNLGQADTNMTVSYSETESDPLMLGPASPPSPVGPFKLAGGASQIVRWTYLANACGDGSVNGVVTGVEIATGKILAPSNVSRGLAVAGCAPTAYLSKNSFDPGKGEQIEVRVIVPAAMRSGVVTVRIYNIAGELIRTVSNVPVQADEARWDWDGKNAKGELVGNGVYLIQIISGNNVQTKRVIILKR